MSLWKCDILLKVIIKTRSQWNKPVKSYSSENTHTHTHTPCSSLQGINSLQSKKSVSGYHFSHSFTSTHTRAPLHTHSHFASVWGLGSSQGGNVITRRWLHHPDPAPRFTHHHNIVDFLSNEVPERHRFQLLNSTSPCQTHPRIHTQTHSHTRTLSLLTPQCCRDNHTGNGGKFCT